eukprot:2403081-Prymnesium_polylepis.1
MEHVVAPPTHRWAQMVALSVLQSNDQSLVYPQRYPIFKGSCEGPSCLSGLWDFLVICVSSLGCHEQSFFGALLLPSRELLEKPPGSVLRLRSIACDSSVRIEARSASRSLWEWARTRGPKIWPKRLLGEGSRRMNGKRGVGVSEMAVMLVSCSRPMKPTPDQGVCHRSWPRVKLSWKVRRNIAMPMAIPSSSRWTVTWWPLTRATSAARSFRSKCCDHEGSSSATS